MGWELSHRFYILSLPPWQGTPAWLATRLAQARLLPLSLSLSLSLTHTHTHTHTRSLAFLSPSPASLANHFQAASNLRIRTGYPSFLSPPLPCQFPGWVTISQEAPRLLCVLQSHPGASVYLLVVLSQLWTFSGGWGGRKGRVEKGLGSLL